MNIIDIVILVILGASVVLGLYKGFLHTILSVGCCLLSILIAFFFGPHLADIVSGNQSISSSLATYTDAVARVGDYELASTDVNQMDNSLISRVLDSVNLPPSIENVLRGNLETRNYQNTGLSTVNDYVSNTIVSVALDILCFIAAFALSYLVLSLVVSLIQHVFKLPLLKQLDWLAGGTFGLVRGAVVLYVIFLAIPILSTVIPLDAFNDLIEKSTLAGIFQSDGLFAQVIGRVF